MKTLLPTDDDIALAGVSSQLFVRRTLIVSVSAGIIAALSLSLVATAGVHVPLLGVCVVVISSVVVAWSSSVRRVRSRAQRLRAEMELAVAAFLDLVNVLLAGGAGVETAMVAAAGAGGGWSFEQIRLALARARSSRGSYWDSLADLGRDLGVDALEEVAHSVQLAGEHGARVRQSLVSKAVALRSRNLARIEHEAQRRTEHMGTPIVVLFVGFILLVGYPAFTASVGAL